MLTIYTSDRFLKEKEYVFHVVLHEMLGISYRVVCRPDEGNYRLLLPNGAELNISNHFWSQQEPVSANTLTPGLFPHPFRPGEHVIDLFGHAEFSQQHNQITCGLDFFGAAFFMLTRIEENNPDAFDAHGRFPAEKSLAFRGNFLQRPVVNEWADLLYQILQRLGWQQPRPVRHFQRSFSCDVDHPRLWWSFTDRLKTLGGAILKRRDAAEALYFIRRHLFGRQDPYDVFDEWLRVLEQHNLVAQFNFLGERPRSSDCWYPLQHPFVRHLMTTIAARGHGIGFHPSYEAFEQPDVFIQELNSLQAVSPVPVVGGRQHYLRFDATRTWRMWQDAGLIWDSTVGYPEAEGFRCGICHDFPVFDAEKREMLSLREKPLLAMDVTLAQYKRYSPEEAEQRLLHLWKQVEKHGGDFTLLWHNSSWNTPLWEPWKQVMLHFIKG